LPCTGFIPVSRQKKDRLSGLEVREETPKEGKSRDRSRRDLCKLYCTAQKIKRYLQKMHPCLFLCALRFPWRLSGRIHFAGFYEKPGLIRILISSLRAAFRRASRFAAHVVSYQWPLVSHAA